MNSDTLPPIDKKRLRMAMDQAFNNAELNGLCADLGVEVENLAGTVKKEKILELIKYLERHHRLPDLLAWLDESRPDFDLTAVQSSHKKRYAGVILAIVVLVLVGAAWAVVRTGRFCPYHDSSDYETIVQIIKAESQAVNEGNLQLIEDIFAPDAYIKQTEKEDGAVVEWFDPMAHYGPLFDKTRYFGAMHTDIAGTVSGNFARFTSGSAGRFLTGDTRGEYHNEAGNPAEEEVWTLEKNVWGCWKITRFEFH